MILRSTGMFPLFSSSTFCLELRSCHAIISKANRSPGSCNKSLATGSLGRQYSSVSLSHRAFPALRSEFRGLARLKNHTASSRISSNTASGVASSSSIISTVSEIPDYGGKVGLVTVSNATKLNIVNSELLVKLREELLALHSTSDLRAVVLTGATAPEKSPAFIGGADINEMTAIGNYDEARTFITKIHEVCESIRSMPVPVIARVHGFALGAGLEIMAACDLRAASETSIFGMPEVKVGIPSVIEARLLADLIGWGRTRRLLYLAENITASLALKWGLIEEICTGPEVLDQSVNEWVSKIAQNGPLAMRSQKKLIKHWESCDVDSGIKEGIDAFATSWKDGGKEPKTMMDKFLNRRK